MEEIYKCPECGATDRVEDLEEDGLYEGYRCNNCLGGVMILQKPKERKLNFKINATGWQRRSLIGKPIENLLNRFDFPIAYGFLSKSGIYTSLEIELECSDRDFIKVNNRVSRMLLKYQVLRAD